ncbi:MAG: hypothetical protein NPIRA05_21710 [Nitrospirales bacterium]|nr:MAG: hypothetical protein NPIRA05_21710 [Nitrospirales bacterium]
MESQFWLTFAGMQDNLFPPLSHFLKILPVYMGLNSVEAILQVSRARRLLWLEILFNEQLDLKPWQNHPDVQDAYQKACQWFSTYRSLIQSVLPRVSLPLNNGKIDQRDYRRFAEALQFLAPSFPPPKSISE